jgi:hypothetical protein
VVSYGGGWTEEGRMSFLYACVIYLNRKPTTGAMYFMGRPRLPRARPDECPSEAADHMRSMQGADAVGHKRMISDRSRRADEVDPDQAPFH